VCVCVCVLALVIRHENRVFPSSYYLPSVPCLALPYFFRIITSQMAQFFKNVIEYKLRGLIFFTTLVWNISHSKTNSGIYYHKRTQVLKWSTCYYCQILIKSLCSTQIFEKHRNVKFHENPSSGSRVVPCGQTDRHNEANCHFSQFCERGYKTTAQIRPNVLHTFRLLLLLWQNQWGTRELSPSRAAMKHSPACKKCNAASDCKNQKKQQNECLTRGGERKNNPSLADTGRPNSQVIASVAALPKTKTHKKMRHKAISNVFTVPAKKEVTA